MSNLRTALVEGWRRAITASAASPFTFPRQLTGREAASTSCPERMPWKGLVHSRGVKITFSLTTNLKQGTLDMCRKAQRGGVCVCSVDQELGGGFHFFLPHSWLACAAVVADIFQPMPTRRIKSQISLHGSELGRCWWLHPMHAADPGCPGTDSNGGFCYWWTMCSPAVLRLSGKNLSWNTTKVSSILKKGKKKGEPIIPTPPNAEDLI